MKALDWFLVAVLVAGCAYGNESYVKTTPINEMKLPPTEGEVELIFSDKVPTRKYTEVALLEAVGKELAENAELMNLLKQRAKQLGADAVISIKLGHKEETSGEIGMEMVSMAAGRVPDKYKYQAPVMTGVAIKYE